MKLNNNQIPDTMKLPKGKTCADCFHIERCKMLFQCNPENIICDWNPNRFAKNTKSNLRKGVE